MPAGFLLLLFFPQVNYIKHGNSILYKTQLPFIVVFNKTDIKDCDFALKWMTDFEAFQEDACSDQDPEGSRESYMTSLTKSMSLALEEFYKTLRVFLFY